jgi:hypothetical protein
MSWVAAAVGAVGLGTTIYGDIKAHKTQSQLANMKSPVYTPSQSIADYYNKALQRYSINPMQSATYQQSLQNAQQATAQGYNALQGRGAAVAGASALTAGQNNALLGATGQAQQQQAQALSQVGQAAGAQSQQQQQAFDINQQQPFTRNYNLLAMKAGGYNQIANAGLQTFGGAVNSYMQSNALGKYFGQQGGQQAPVGGYQSSQIPAYQQAAANIPGYSAGVQLPY